jgi:hypothetical protein
MNFQDKITPLSFTEEHKGKLISVSKRKYTWEFEHNDHTHTLILEMSILSRKVVIYFDGKFISKGTRSLFKPFQYGARVHNLVVIITENLFSFDLYINKQLFPKEKLVNVALASVKNKNSVKEPFPELPTIPKESKEVTRVKRNSKSMNELENDSPEDDGQSYLKVESPRSTSQTSKELKDFPRAIKYRYMSLNAPNYFYSEIPPDEKMETKKHQFSIPPKCELDSFQILDKGIFGPQHTDAIKAVKQQFAVRRLKFDRLSNYEFGNETYHKMSFSKETQAIKNLIRKIYE